MRRRGYQRSASMALQIMYDSSLQTRARHAIFRFGQLELGRPIAPSVATLGVAIMICRLAVLRHSEHEEDQEKGFVGNTIQLTQPRPQEIMQTLPPGNDEVSNCLSVCFNNDDRK